MPAGKFVSYLRVSTDRQGISGLGLEAQRKTVSDFLNGGAWEILAEFVEIESGRKSDRPELARALAHCRITGATLIVANVSRLTRSSSFLHRLLEAGVEVRFCDLPQIEGPTGRFLLSQMVAVAELEAGLIGERTKKALAAAKARGKKLGTPANLTNTDAGRAAGRAQRTQIADRKAQDIIPIIRELQAQGFSLNACGRELTRRGIPTPGGALTWGSKTVINLLARAPQPETAPDVRRPTHRAMI